MKKISKIIIASALSISIISGSIAGLLLYKNAHTTVDVFPVSMISTSDLGSQSTSYGIVTTDISQDVYITEDMVIQEVLVAEGDLVTIGTPLIQLDTTLAALDLELQELTINNIDIQIEAANRELYFLEHASPTKKPSSSDTPEVLIESNIYQNLSSPATGTFTPGISGSENTPDYSQEENPYDGILPSEREAKLKETKRELAALTLDRKEAVLTYEKMEQEVSEGTIRSTVNGQVKSLGNMDSMIDSNTPFLTVTSSEGFYLEGTINEMDLEQISVGHKISITNWETGTMAEAEITSISKFPVSDNTGSWGVNPNTSNYPFTAYLADAEGFQNYQTVDITFESADSTPSETIYIPVSYIRDDNGESYVYIRDENERLKRQTVETGAMLYGYYQEIKSGLTQEDFITFPYGKNVKNGVKTIETDTPPVW